MSSGDFGIIIKVMSSLAKRQQLVNELRKAHFSLGYSHNPALHSEYVREYQQKQLDTTHNPTHNKRDHHYQLGTDDPVFQTQFKDSFPQHTAHQPEGLSQEKMKDLRRQHFVLGYDQGMPDTTYTQEFYKKEAEQAGNKEEGNLKGHKHDFGDSLTYFSSMYKETLNKNLEGFQAPEKVAIDPNAQRRTNMILGNEPPQYQTQSSDAFQNRVSSVVRPIRAAQANISLGSENVGFHSSQRRDYSHKMAATAKVDQDRIRDFKSAHFKLGSHVPVSLQSQHQGEYSQKSLDPDLKLLKPEDNIDLSMDYPNSYNSTYKGNFVGERGEVSQPCRPSGELASLGTDPRYFESEAKACFTKHPYDPTTSFKDTGDRCNIQLGDGLTDYNTQHMDTYKDRFGQMTKNDLSKEEIKDLKGKHFEHGYKDPTYLTTNGLYGQRQGPPSSVAAEQVGVRRGNIYDQDPDVKKTTTYKTSFHWKVNNEY